MKTTKSKTSRSNTKTNWERVSEFLFGNHGADIVLDEDHRIVCYEIWEDGLVLNLGQTSGCDEPNDQIVFSPDCINKGTIEGNSLNVSYGGECHSLGFYKLVGGRIK